MKNTYYCMRCNFNTNKKSILLNHLNKKNKCRKNLSIYFVPNDILYEMSNLPKNLDNSNFQCSLCMKNYSCKYLDFE